MPLKRLLVNSIIISILCAIAPMAAASQHPLRVAYQNRVGSVLPILAVNQGFFADQGLQVESQVFSSGPACAEALYSGAADIATMGDTTAVIALSRSLPLRLLTSHASGEHRHRLMVMNPALRQVSDLRGKRIGVKKGTSTFGGLLALLKQHGLTAQDVTLINLSPSTLIEALQAGSIDALAASEPTPSLAEMKGAQQLATLGGLGNNYPILLLARESFCLNDPLQLDAFMRALEAARQFLEQHRDQAEQIVAVALNLPLDVTHQAMLNHEYHLSLDENMLSSLKETAKFLHQQKILSTSAHAQFCHALAQIP